MAIELIKTISLAPINSIKVFRKQNNKVVVDALWRIIPMHVSSGQLSSVSRQDGPGTSYTTNVSARLKNSLGEMPYCIVKIELCSERTLILGTPDIPIKPNENISLSIVNFNINHNSIDGPLELV